VKKKFILISFIIVLFCLLKVTIAKKNSAQEQKKFTIVATTSMLADALHNIVGDQLIVHGLMGPGIDPHVYRARESDVHKLAAANLVVYNGLHLEGKIGHVLQGMNRFTEVINASDALDKQKLRVADFEGLYDPHIWFDVTLWIVVVRSIQDAVMKLDPEHASIYKKNSDEYIMELEQLHRYVKVRVAELQPRQKILITAHDAFGYFGAAYDFQVVGLQGLSTDCDISTQDIQKLADYIVSKKIPTVFLESSISSRSMCAVQEAVAAQGWRVILGNELYSDALGDPKSAAASYIDMVKHNVDTIVEGLRIISPKQ
jgi:manganese/zinc/iron transport system substrate-binding protein